MSLTVYAESSFVLGLSRQQEAADDLEALVSWATRGFDSTMAAAVLVDAEARPEETLRYFLTWDRGLTDLRAIDLSVFGRLGIQLVSRADDLVAKLRHEHHLV